MRLIKYTHRDAREFTVSIKLFTPVNTDDLLKIEMAADHMAKALASHEFKEFCLNYKYSYKKCTGHLWWKKCKKIVHHGMKKTNGWGPNIVYEAILSGSEALRKEVDFEADIELEIDYHNKRGVIGYTYPSSKRQWIYSWFFKKYDFDHIAGNLAHEYCHKLGFKHNRKFNKSRRHTIPYAVGYFVRDFKGE